MPTENNRILVSSSQLVVSRVFKSKIASHWSEIETEIKSTGLHGLKKSKSSEVQGFEKSPVKGFKKVPGVHGLKKDREVRLDDDGADEGFGHQTHRGKREGDELLSESVSEELENEIVGDKLGLKFVLKQALSEIHFHETRTHAFPLPSSMEVSQWKQLISLTDRRARFYYLDSLLGNITFEEVEALDEIMSNPLVVPEEMISEAVGDDSESRRRINMFLMHHEIMRQDGEEVPYELKVKDLRAIADIQTVGGWKKYINFMNITWNKKTVNLIRKRITQSTEYEGKKAKSDEAAECDHIYYGLGHNAIFIRKSEMSMKEHYHWQVMREFVIGTPLIVDFSYLEKIKSRQYIKGLIHNEACVAMRNNKVASHPFALHFTGVDRPIKQMMKSAFNATENFSNCPVEISEKHHLDLYPQEKLVYLSPDSRNDLVKYNDDDIYVIGGIIDRGDDRAPMTLASAKKLNIRHARFPMRKTIGIQADLNVETCVAIMNDLKASQDWFYALRWVPARFLANRVKVNPDVLQNKLAYRAHKALSPTVSIGSDNCERNLLLTAKQYRSMYTKIMAAKSMAEMNELLETLKV